MVTNILIWFSSLILGIIFTLLFQNPIQGVLTKIFGGIIPRKDRGLKGIWYSSYTYESKDKIHTQNHLAEIKQFGNYIIGRRLIGDSHEFKMVGKIYYNIYFSGQWESPVERDINHGTFQLLIDNKGKSMEGKWLGISRERGINHGNWKLEIITTKIDRKTKENLIEDYVPKNLFE